MDDTEEMVDKLDKVDKLPETIRDQMISAMQKMIPQIINKLARFESLQHLSIPLYCPCIPFCSPIPHVIVTCTLKTAMDDVHTQCNY